MRLVVALIFAMACHAVVCNGASVQGIAVDDDTGHALSWAQIHLIPLPGMRVNPVHGQAGEHGTFSFPNVSAGWYVLRVSRDGFADTEAGQMRAGRPGAPFEVHAEDRPRYFQVRMKRLGAVTGSVFDENNVGISDWPVFVYTARKPVRKVAEGLTDERGLFRVGLLESGMYVVAAASGALDWGPSLVPTFFKDSAEFDGSEAVRVRVGGTREDVLIRAQKGSLLELRGAFFGPPGANLTLITETGRRSLATIPKSGAPVVFDAKDVPAGPVEFTSSGTNCGGYTRAIVERGAIFRETCAPLSRPQVTMGDRRFPISIRRLDLDGVGPVHNFDANEPLPPGRWQVMPQPGPDYYAVSVNGNHALDGWFSIEGGRIDIAISSHPAVLSGTISTAGAPAPGAPVYLESYDPERPRLVFQSWTARADPKGGYRFDGLAPGHYRVLSSFDFDPDTPNAMNAATELTLAEGDKAIQPLDMVLP